MDSQNFRGTPFGLRQVLGPVQVLSWALCSAEQAGRAPHLGMGHQPGLNYSWQ